MILEITPEHMEKMAMEVIDLLMDRDLMEDTCIYANGQCFLSAPTPNGGERTTPKGRRVYAVPCPAEEIPGRFKNPETLTAAFEGNRLFEVMNYGGGDIQEQLNAIFKTYDLYMERGYEWSFYACSGGD